MDRTPNAKATTGSLVFKRTALLVLIVSLCILVLAAGLCLLVRFGVDGDQLARLVVPQIEADLGKRIEYSEARLEWLSSHVARVSLSGIKVSDQGSSQTLLSLPQAVFELDALLLLKGTLQVRLARFSEPVFSVPPGTSWQRDPPQAGAGDLAPPFFLTPVIDRLQVNRARLMLGNSANLDSNATTLLSDIEVTGTDITLSGASSFSIKGIAPSGTKQGSFHVSGKITATPLYGPDWGGDVRVLLSAFPIQNIRLLAAQFKKELPVSEGSIDLDVALKGEPKQFDLSCDATLSSLVLAPGRVFLRNVPVGSARFRFTANRSANDLLVNFSQVAVPGLTLAVEAKVTDLTSPDAMLTVALRKADLDLRSFFPLIPLNLFRAEDRDRLKDAGLTGHIALTGGQWSGKLADFLEKWSQGTIVLDALLDKVSGFIPGVGLRVVNATGQVRYSADEVLFKSVSLTVGSSPIVLNGWIQDLQAKPRIDLFLNMTAQAQDLKPLLESPILEHRLRPWLGFVGEPSGGIALTLDIKGDLYRPAMQGRLQVDDFQCRVKGLPLPVKKVAGSVNFRSSGVTFSGMKGLVGDSPLELSGNLSPEMVEITADAKLHPNDLKMWMPGSWAISGMVPISVTVKGKNPTVNFSVDADFKSNAVRVGSFFSKKPGVPLRIEASGTRDGEGISVEEAYLVFNQARISAKLNISEDGTISLFANLPPRGIQTDDLVSLANPDIELQPGGRLEGDAVIKTSIDKTHETAVEANLKLSHVSLRLPGMYKRAEGITGSIYRRAKSINVSIERAKVGSSVIQGTMSIADWDNPRVEIDLESPFLDTTDFTAPPGFVHKLTWGEWIRVSPVITFLARGRGTGSLKIAKGKTAVRTFSNFQAQFEGAHGLIRSTKWQMGLAEGIVRGSGLFDIRSNTQKPLTVDFQGDQLRIERLMLSDPDRVKIAADMVAEGHMEWKLGNTNAENNGMYKTGTLEVRLNDGVIHRFDVLSKIFSLINLGSLVRGRLPDVISQGLSFQRMTWRMEVFDNKWKVKELKLLSDAARIDSSGMYFSGQDRLDFKVDVSPLVGLDALVSGLFGNLLTSNGKILTTTFRVRGLYGSPDVRLEPFENLTHGN